MVEYHLDVFDEKPLEAHRQDNGEIQFKDTGDNLLDKWEQQIVDGEDVNLLEAFSSEEYAKLQTMLAKAKEQNIEQAYMQHMQDMATKVEKLPPPMDSRSPFARKK